MILHTPDPIADEMDKTLERLSKIRPISRNKHTFHMRLPSEQWEEFAGSKGSAFWRQMPCKRGRKVAVQVMAPFDFGRHSHPFKEVFTVEEGACLFGEREMQYMEEGDKLTLAANSIHSLRVLKAGSATVWWPELEGDEIEITAE